nr:hypothetical protein [Tanacetum cinerariifolium]
MAISVVSVSSDSSEESVRTPTERVILFSTIPTTIPDTIPTISPPATHTDTIDIPTIAPTTPLSPDYTPASPDYSPAPNTEFDPSKDTPSDHIPLLPAISPFLSSTDDTTDSDTPDTPSSPTHGIPFTEITSSTQRSPVIPRRRVIILAPGQPIPHDYFSPDDSARDYSLDSSSEASSDFHSDASSDSSSRHSLSDHSSPDLPNIEVDPRETSLRDDVIIRSSDESHLEQDIDPRLQAEIDECIAYANALRDRGIDARVVVEVVDREESETATRGPVMVRVERVTHPAMPEDTTEPDQKERAGCRIVGVELPVVALSERIAELERDNKRPRGIASVEGQRVDRL